MHINTHTYTQTQAHTHTQTRTNAQNTQTHKSTYEACIKGCVSHCFSIRRPNEVWVRLTILNKLPRSSFVALLTSTSRFFSVVAGTSMQLWNEKAERIRTIKQWIAACANTNRNQHTQTHTLTHAYARTNTQTHPHTLTHTRMHAYARTNTQTHPHTHTHSHARTHTHPHKRITYVCAVRWKFRVSRSTPSSLNERRYCTNGPMQQMTSFGSELTNCWRSTPVLIDWLWRMWMWLWVWVWVSFSV